MKVLLLEDDRDAREALAALLVSDAFAVLQAADAAGFAAVTAVVDVDALIFDQRLADGSDGLTLAADYQARRRGAGQSPARLICVSGSSEIVAGSPELPLRYLRKPADYAEILAALRARTPS